MWCAALVRSKARRSSCAERMQQTVATRGGGAALRLSRDPDHRRGSKRRGRHAELAALARLGQVLCPMSPASNDPLHGITLEALLTELVSRHGFEELALRVNIRCFSHEPSIKSSLKFLRRTEWARTAVEQLYLADQELLARKRQRNQERAARRAYAAARDGSELSEVDPGAELEPEPEELSGEAVPLESSGPSAPQGLPSKAGRDV
jgi:uncharacterized protein (DUF2132 family)